ncbi:MAG: tetratricopeptide repeat protein [Terriglobia bacterium]
MVHVKNLLTNRVLISLLIILALAGVFEFYLHPFAGPFYKSGLQAYKSGDYTRSVRMLQEARAYEPNNPAILTLLGWSLLKTGKPALAEKWFDAARRFTPHDSALQLGLVYAEIGLGRPARAGAILNEIRKERPEWIEISIAQGILYRHEGLAKMAGMEFRQALSRDPHNAVALKNLQEISARNAPLPLEAWGRLPGGPIAPPSMTARPPVAQNSVPVDPNLSLARVLESRDEFPEAVARYHTYLKSHPGSLHVLYDVGELLMRTNQAQEAVPLFRQILAIDSQNAGGTMGLAEALATTGHYRESLFRYRQVLNASPGNYEARQGMANVLLWTRHYAAAKPLFETLANEDPGDPVNQQALQTIAGGEEAAHWVSLRPPPGSPPADVVQYDESYLASHPADHATLAELATNQTKLKDTAGAISTYRQIIKLYPADEDSELRLAQELASTQHYSEAIRIYQDLLQTSPRDPDLLQDLARVDRWANRLPDSLQLEQRLLKQQPSNTELMLRSADLEMRLKNYSEARETLATVATLRPDNRVAQLGLAALDEKRGDWQGARRDYQRVLAHHPGDAEALYRDAKLAYYQGDRADALNEAEQVIHEQPRNTDALLLAARIENAKGKRQQAEALVARASQIAPGDAEVGEMQQTLRQESAVTLHTSSTYAREVGPLTDYFSPQGVLIKRIPNEDLNTYSNAALIGFPLFPRSQSSISMASMPSNSPYGGIRGAVGPAEFEYRQSTEVASFLTLRGGIGFERFGPPYSVALPSQNPTFPTRITSVPVTAVTPVGYGGFTVRPTPQLSLDFAISRDGVAYTPLTVRFGVIQARKLIGLHYKADRSDQVHLTYYKDAYRSALWYRANPSNSEKPTLSANGVDQATGGTLDYDHTLIQSERFSLGAGYSGETFGYTGPHRGVYMGFFNPTFYQRHFAVARSQGHIWGPLSYKFAGGYGLQQLAHHQPFIPAYQVNPSLAIRVN